MSDWTDIYEFDDTDVHGNMTDWVNSSNPGTKLEKSFFDDHSGKTIAAILDVLRGSTTDTVHNIVYAHEYSSIQAAIDDLPAAGGICFVAPGTYEISSAITMKSKVQLIGAGRESTIIKTTGAVKGIVFGDGGTTECRHCLIKNIYLHGNSVGTNAIEFDGGSGGHVKENRIENVNIGGNWTTYAIHLKDWCFTNYFDGCKLHGGGVTTHGFYMADRCNDITIHECDVNSFATWGILINATTESANNRIINSQFDSNGGTGSPASGKGCIKLHNNAQANVIMGNYIENTKGTGIRHEAGTVLIMGNYINGNDTSNLSDTGIHAVTAATIIANKIIGGASNKHQTAGINLASGSTDIVCINNATVDSVAGGGDEFVDGGITNSFVVSQDGKGLSVGKFKDDATYRGYFQKSSAAVALGLDGDAAQLRDFAFLTAGVARWFLRCDATAEGGSNAGSDFSIQSRADNGSSLAVVHFIQRSTGRAVIGGATVKIADLTLNLAGTLGLKETTTPSADADYGKVYTKNDNKLYFQDGAGAEHEIAFA